MNCDNIETLIDNIGAVVGDKVMETGDVEVLQVTRRW